MAKRTRIRPGDRTKAIGVVRVSTSKQDIGAAAQRDELQRWAAMAGVELVAIHEDIGVGGSAPLERRPGLVAALAALAEHRAGLLVAVKRDRFARCRFTIADVERAARAAGAVLVTTDGTCDGTGSESEEMGASLQDLIASMELRKIKARNKARAQRCIAQGRLHGGDAPFGWRRKAEGVVGRGGRVVELEPDPSEQETIATIRDLRAGGLSLRAIARALGERGIATRTGKPWQAMTIRRILARAG